MLTVIRLDLPRELRPLLACTNIIENARRGPPGRPQRQAVAQCRDGPALDRRPTDRGPEDLPTPQGLPAAAIRCNALQDHMRKAQPNSAIETIMKVA